MKTKLLCIVLAVGICSSAYAINDVETVANVTEDRILTTPLDLVITNETEALRATIDIANDDAAIIFENVNPTTVISNYLSKITINGENAASGTNCRVGIYRHGAIVMPRGKSYPALTVYTEPDFGGESRIYTQGSRQATLVKFNNNIRSFKLKRGYMATFANHTDGTGYSHCYIADREDLEINLPNTMAGRVSMLRVFAWNWVSKKGCSDSRDTNMMNTAHATWYYDWGAGKTSRTNHEYVPQRHNEGGNTNGSDSKPSYWKAAWESWANINASDETCTHVLGQNEPDNTSGQDEVYTYVTTIPDNPREHYSPTTLVSVAKEFLYSGKRIGTFACCNPNAGWVREYVNYCRENNIRIDFVATHYYKGGQAPASCIGDLKSLYNATGLPVWVTEWNNGANWTNEPNFYTDSEGWYNWGSGNDQYKNGVWLRDVLKRADDEPWLERLAVYNAVEWKRQITNGSTLTDCGKVWATHLSKQAFDSRNGGINYFMPWTHHNPSDLAVEYNNSKKTATFTWKNPDTDMADSTRLEYKNGSKWVPVATIPLSDDEEMTYTLNVSDWEPAMYSFRVSRYDYDGVVRRTAEIATLTIAAANAIGQLQFGQLKIANAESVTTEIEAQEVAPYVVMGMISYKNTSNGIINQIQNLSKGSFKFRFLPWTLKTPVTLANAETVDYLILPADTVCHLPGGMMLISKKAGSIKGTESEIVFPEPFPDGVIPVVVAQQNTSSANAAPAHVRVYDVTNTGFKVRLERQEGITSNFNGQNVNYFAASPGQEPIGHGKMLTVGRNETQAVGGSTARTITLVDGDGETLYFQNPYIIAASQTHNYEKTSIFRLDSKLNQSGKTYALSIRRQDDPSSTVTTSSSATKNGDYIGWFIVSDDPDGTGDEHAVIVPTGIVQTKESAGFNVSVHNGAIYAEGTGLHAYSISGTEVGLGVRLPAGIYVVTNGQRSIRIAVK